MMALMRIYMVRQFIWFKKKFEVEGYVLTRQGGRRDDAVSRSGCNENKVAGCLHYQRSAPGGVHAAWSAFGSSTTRRGLFLRKFGGPVPGRENPPAEYKSLQGVHVVEPASAPLRAARHRRGGSGQRIPGAGTHWSRQLVLNKTIGPIDLPRFISWKFGSHKIVELDDIARRLTDRSAMPRLR
jgi:hypothetical protein